MSSKIDDKCIEYLHSIDFPFSLIGTPYKYANNVNHADNDNYMAAYELTRYLSMTGRGNFAMIAGDENLMVTKKRIDGFTNALAESNLKFDRNYLFIGSFDEKTGYKYGEMIANLNPRPDALIVTDDLVAYGAVRQLESLGISIPRDISVASFNNSSLSRHCNIPITSVDVNSAELGKEALNLLVNAIENGTRGKKIIIPYTIFKRKSTEV